MLQTALRGRKRWFSHDVGTTEPYARIFEAEVPFLGGHKSTTGLHYAPGFK